MASCQKELKGRFVVLMNKKRRLSQKERNGVIVKNKDKVII